MSDYSFRKGFSETFVKGMEIGSNAAQKRLETIAKQREKLADMELEMEGRNKLSEFTRQNALQAGKTEEEADIAAKTVLDLPLAQGIKIASEIQKGNPTEFQKEQEKRRTKSTEIAEESLKVREKQQRRIGIESFGASFDFNNPEDESDVKYITGNTKEGLINSGRMVRNPDGTFSLMDKNVWDRFISEGKFTPDEQKVITNHFKEINAWNQVMETASKLGLGEKKDGVFRVVNEKVENPFLAKMGVLSLPARLEFAKQYADDPNYKVLDTQLQLAFQAFRQRVTGAQASDKELVKLFNTLPNLTNQPDKFFATINKIVELSKQDYNILLDTKENFGRNVDQFRIRDNSNVAVDSFDTKPGKLSIEEKKKRYDAFMSKKAGK